MTPEPSESLLRLREQRDEMAGQLAMIRASLDKVAVLEGVDKHAYLTLCVSEVVRDHEELEARIDAAMMEIAAGCSDMARIAYLLQGGTRLPDGVE